MMILNMMFCLSMVLQNQSIYDFSFNTVDGVKVDLADFKGKNILIVNTASECGFTKQYKDLQQLHEQYGKDLVVIGFPANNFGGQEPGSNEEIADFCEKNFGVSFLLSEKVDVIGEDISPLFKFLTTEENTDFTGDIQWNFEKFLVNKDGKLIHRYRSKVNPLDEKIVEQLKAG